MPLPKLPAVPTPPAASSPQVRAVMQGNRGLDTRPEVALRSALHRRGLRFFKARRPAPEVGCRADVIFPAARVAVFVDGCFWHRCPEHGVSPTSNTTYWRAKLDRNVARDRKNDAALAAAGWRVVRIWEHEDPDAAAAAIAHLVHGSRHANDGPIEGPTVAEAVRTRFFCEPREPP